MVKVVRTLVPEKHIPFEDIISFKTENYTGVWNYANDAYGIFKTFDNEFFFTYLPVCKTLEELDEAVYKECEERILFVSDRCDYEFVLN